MITDDKHAEILKNHDDDVSAQSTVRDERIPDISFARWSQLDDDMDESCTTEFMGEFNIIGRERKNIQAEFRQNEVEVNFRTRNGDDDDLDDLMQGMYRTDTALSRAKQCFKIAQDDAMDCGFGAWRMHTIETDPEDSLSTEKSIAFSPIPEAIRSVFFDCNSKLYDKSDAMRCSIITSYTEDAYKKFLESEDISEDDAGFSSFDSPYRSIYEQHYGQGMQNPLYSKGNREINLLEYYEITKKKEWVYQYLTVNEEGEQVLTPIPKKEAEESERTDEPLNKKRVEITVCKKYISNGVKVLKESVVPGGHIPIIPLYCERNFVDGVENFYGIVKAAKDPQKLYNATFNYLTSLMMYSPIPKPVLDEREIEGFEDDWDGANNHQLAYKRKHKFYKDENTNELMQFMPEQTQPAQVPPAVAQLMAQLPALTDSILNPGVTEESFNSNMSGVALQQINEQIGVIRYIMLDNYNESMQRTAEIYAAMASQTFDTPRKVVVTNANGTTALKQINKPSFDMVLMQATMQNQIKDAKFNIYSKVAPSYKSQRDAALGNLKELHASFIDPHDPMAKLVQLSILAQQDGEGIEEINKVARFQMLDMGLPGIDPQTEEEAQYVQMKQQQAAQQQQSDPAAQAMQAEAQARMMEGQAAIQNEVNDANKLMIDKQKVDNDTARVQIEAQQAGMEIQVKMQDLQKNQLDMFDKQVTIEGKQIDNINKVVDAETKVMTGMQQNIA